LSITDPIWICLDVDFSDFSPGPWHHLRDSDRIQLLYRNMGTLTLIELTSLPHITAAVSSELCNIFGFCLLGVAREREDLYFCVRYFRQQWI
jgi:hypothetical protein